MCYTGFIVRTTSITARTPHAHIMRTALRKAHNHYRTHLYHDGRPPGHGATPRLLQRRKAAVAAQKVLNAKVVRHCVEVLVLRDSARNVVDVGIRGAAAASQASAILDEGEELADGGIGEVLFGGVHVACELLTPPSRYAGGFATAGARSERRPSNFLWLQLIPKVRSRAHFLASLPCHPPTLSAHT